MKTETWADLKAFANSLTNEQLKQKVIVWGEGYSKIVDSISIMEDDMIDPSGDGCEPISVYINDPEYADMIDEPVLVTKGGIRISANYPYSPE